MCQTYLDGIQAQALGAFDTWSEHIETAAAAFGGVLDELFTGAGHCVPSPANPGAIVLTPLPSAHYQVCGWTSVCQARCASQIAVFNAELQRTPVPDAPPSSTVQTVESPLFNVYASADSSSAMTVVALATLPAGNATDACRTRCGASGDCMAVVRGQTALQLDFFCIPDPALIAATVFPTTLDSAVLAGADTMQTATGYTFQHVEVLWPPLEQPWVVAYTSLTASSVAIDGTVKSSTAHEVWAWRTGTRYRVLGTDDLAAEALTVSVQQALFDGSTLAKPQIGTCSISTIVGVISQTPPRLVFFIAFTVQLQGFIDNDAQKQHLSGHTLQSVAKWSPDVPRTSTYSVPGASATTKGLEGLLALGQSGTFMRSAELLINDSSTAYIAIDSSSSSVGGGGTLYARRVRIEPSDNALVWSDTLTPWRLAQDDSDTTNLLGTWTRATVYSLLAPVHQKPIRDTRTRGAQPLRWFQVSSSSSTAAVKPTSIGAWMYEARGSLGARGWTLRAFGSQQTTGVAVLNVKCTYQSCTGCATARLRLLCHQAQDCVLSQCVGTVVQTRNVLCGIGGVLEQTARHALATWRALFDALVELGLLVMRGLSGDIAQTIALRFPTDQVASS